VSEDKRKHRHQMAAEEILAVEDLVHRQPSSAWNFGGPHVAARMKAKGVSMEEALETLRSGYLVEVNENRDLCAVFRNDTGKSSVCVVVALRTRWFVTTWRNGRCDRHTTLDLTKYTWVMDMGKVMEAFAC
jgi:hypothetical protein